jgi:hypothetical protein
VNGDTTDREERIRKRAHRLWQQAGEPEGRDEEFWHLATTEIDAEDREQI